MQRDIYKDNKVLLFCLHNDHVKMIVTKTQDTFSLYSIIRHNVYLSNIYVLIYPGFIFVICKVDTFPTEWVLWQNYVIVIANYKYPYMQTLPIVRLDPGSLILLASVIVGAAFLLVWDCEGFTPDTDPPRAKTCLLSLTQTLTFNPASLHTS